MKETKFNRCAERVGRLLLFALWIVCVGCSRVERAPAVASLDTKPTPNPLTIVLSAHEGTGKVDREIQKWQEQIRNGQQAEIALERLGWLFVAKARESFDPGFYKFAEQCALALETRQPRSAEAMLLQAHILQNLHRFAESEAVARKLAATRGLAFDFGVLGDALMEQGKLDEAIDAYQKMADLKPDLHAQLRAAHVRWLKGDLEGAIEMMEMAASAVSPRDADTAAWAFTRLAGYQFQARQFDEVRQNTANALEIRADYPPALLLRGRMLLSENQYAEAVEVLQKAEIQNPLPEYQWALIDAFEAADRSDAAKNVAEKLRRHGAKTDPRTYALYLATRKEQPQLALRLAEKEMNERGDVFTLDAYAWAEAMRGQPSVGGYAIKRALEVGTQDARLFLHAAVIAARTGDTSNTKLFSEKTFALRHLLLPSERKHLETLSAQVTETSSVAGADQEKF